MTIAKPSDAPSLLLVDDDAVFRERLARAFRARGYEVTTAEETELPAFTGRTSLEHARPLPGGE